MTLRKTTWIMLIALTAFAVWAPRQWHLLQTRQALTNAVTQREVLARQAAGAEADLEALRRQISAEQVQRARALEEASQAKNTLANAKPDNHWTVPPANLPDWNPESPYVWMPKETLPKLPVPVFESSGELIPEVAEVLTISQPQRQILNAALRQCLDQYHEIEISKVEAVGEHLPGIAGQDGEKYSIRVPVLPEEGTLARQQFAGALAGSLGEQRADLLLQLADGWLDQQFSQAGQPPKTISLLVRPQGGYNVSIRSGSSWRSSSVDKSRPDMIWHFIPKHLAPIFSGVLGESTGTDR